MDNKKPIGNRRPAGRRPVNNRKRSTIIFLIFISILGLLCYSGINGLTVGGYRVKPLSEVINRGLDLQVEFLYLKKFKLTRLIKAPMIEQ